MTWPRCASVAALYALQNSMMFTPCGPRAVPTGGAGVAAPAFKATLTRAATFFLGGIAMGPSGCAADGRPSRWSCRDGLTRRGWLVGPEPDRPQTFWI